jgi:hypothetical protein
VADAPLGRPLPRIPQIGRASGQEIRVERDDDVGVAEIVVGIDWLAKRQRRSGTRLVRARGLPLMPFRGRVQRLNRAHLLRNRRRRDRLGQKADAGAALALLIRQGRLQNVEKGPPGPHFAGLLHRRHAIGIVKLQHRCLREHIASAERGRMLGVALDLGRPAFVTLRQDSPRHAVDRRGGREE